MSRQRILRTAVEVMECEGLPALAAEHRWQDYLQPWAHGSPADGAGTPRSSRSAVVAHGTRL